MSDHDRERLAAVTGLALTLAAVVVALCVLVVLQGSAIRHTQATDRAQNAAIRSLR